MIQTLGSLPAKRTVSARTSAHRVLEMLELRLTIAAMITASGLTPVQRALRIKTPPSRR